MIEDWKGKRVMVMGLGRFGGGVGVTRWLAQSGARVLVTDKAPAEKLRESVEEIADLDVELRLGEHVEGDFRETDLVVVSPAVSESSPFLQAARDAGVPITTEINLFVERCPARCIGVTGTVGKSTITAMIGHVLQRTVTNRRVWVGGNVGRSLLEDLSEMTADDLVVLELSSFQLARTSAVRWSPQVAVVTNISPNHLDWHDTFAAYVAAKLNIVRYQDPGRDAIVIGDDAELQHHFDLMFGDVSGIWRYGLDGDVPVAVMQTTPAVDCDDRRLRWEGVQLAVPGRHNRENSAAALTVAHVLGVEADAAVAALATFDGLPHRLRRVAVRDGVTYYNDSKATTPRAAITAMNALDAPLLIILGGYDKGIDLSAAAELAAKRARFSACIGQTGPALLASIRAAGGKAELFDGLTAAVAACGERAQPGDAVLLSPACASWDMFADYRARGEEFARLAIERAGASL
ncbi:MAG: UDP-N-acetylmuramoyl-L-alanine--D-glutamate ligase [Phycisphaerae bacterium]